MKEDIPYVDMQNKVKKPCSKCGEATLYKVKSGKYICTAHNTTGYLAFKFPERKKENK